MWRSLRQISGTTTAKLSALYLILFAFCAVVLVFYMTALSARMLTTQMRQTISEEVGELNRFYSRGGVNALLRTIDRRSRHPGANLYLVADGAGRIVAGNVAALEPGVLDHAGWSERPFEYERIGERDDDPKRALARIYRLPNGLIALVGRDIGEPERFREIVKRALIFALTSMAVGGFLIWFFIGRRALKRIKAVSDAGRSIMQGDLGQRLPVTGANDEFDRLSKNLNVMLDRIAELNTGVQQLSSNIAHDLKTPLTRARNRAEAALTEGADNEALRQALQNNVAESDQLIRTFNAILMITKLEARAANSEFEVIDLSTVTADVYELYEPLAEEAGVNLLWSQSLPVKVRGNRELIAQALSNLVDNAIKYSAQTSTTPVVTLSLEGDNGGQIMCCDNGRGIADEQKAEVTKRFVRGEQSRTRPGFGLGLSLAKAVMTFHKGELVLTDNNPGLCASLQFAKAKS